MSNNTYKIEYAKSGRSSCKAKQCKGNIPKETIRIAKVYPSARFEDDGTAVDYFHPQCLFDSQVRARKTTKKVEEIEDLEGFEELSKKDQAAIKQMLQDHLDLKSGKGKKKTTTKKPKKDKEPKQKKFEDFMFHGSDNEGEKKSSSSHTASANTSGDTGITTQPKQIDVKHALSSRWSKSFDPEFLSKFGFDQFLGKKRNSSHLPNNNMVFSALNSVPTPSDVSVVILGQSPIPKRESASGFSYCDGAAQSWRLDKCKATTRNFIKAALLSKGWISKSDDVETVQEALKEIDLPSDAAKDWFKATARQGVLWLNTTMTCTEDKEDDRKPHEQIWSPFIEEVIRVIFNSKVNDSTSDIKGIVFLLLGKHFNGWKQTIEKVHSEIMGIVPIEFIEGNSPVLETFHNTNYLVQTNSMLSKMSTPEIDWFPSSQTDDDYEDEDEEEEEEEEESATAASSATDRSKTTSSPPPKKSSVLAFDEDDMFDTKDTRDEGNSGSIGTNTEIGDDFALLVQEDGTKIKMSDGEDLTLGRQSLQIRDLLAHMNTSKPVNKKSTSTTTTPSTSTKKSKSPPADDSFDAIEKKDLEFAKKLQEEEEKMFQSKGNSDDESSKKRKKPTKKETKPKPKKKVKKNEDDYDDEDIYGFDDDDDEDYVPDEQDDDDDYVPPKTRSQSKPKCKYWDTCYRTNPQHLAEFLHPK
ncbi:SMAD/FHA domain-containing protein [Heterostelium album PN500]|uniref:SMAD/FHA domain-containing protein n=1 Tax=Heterostelium pallidum (strain ATCC 26659 / Pp 5 / PN500) TaxID=670386 RepID=D3AXK0_HETP5|nr:SMAD/FHA domain-containing protein [Heterostelium album PN500]EFA86269.1 SMAD/FHA domain-containing protein [Heterostelium album PN500]|eukprot:XP_020438374.1 SMAD/FHA domain-containing protein [Heterostelium album PN500]